MADNLVGYSRAGDVFHYRWAARRCLGMVYPNASLQTVVIEGSKENKKAGEYVIDVSEYYELPERKRKIEYYQLKHTTVQTDKPFTASDLKATIEGFAKRFLQHLKEKNKPEFSFTIVSNRKVADVFRKNLLAIADGKSVDGRFLGVMRKYTKLAGSKLASFCNLLNIEDSEGDYNVQRQELRVEIAQLLAGSIEDERIDTVTAMVQNRALPGVKGTITREDILRHLGVTSEKTLYPAPAVWDKLQYIISRKQYETLYKKIQKATQPVIIHAAGGVGKSVFTRYLEAAVPEDSLTIAYDCFGAGRYRNRSEPRHRHREALVQIANELATRGLCAPLLVRDTTLDEDIMRHFLFRLQVSVSSLRKTNGAATLLILIDAADNAEMAAIEFDQPCFAHELLRETMPQGCKLVLLCRTERRDLLKPLSNTVEMELEPFIENETFEILQKWFPNATTKDAAEFHRLTAGNPRVQANSLALNFDTIAGLLASLGPYGTTVEDQIKHQLDAAVAKIRESLPAEFQPPVDALCLGLACLPPNIPLEVLAQAANITTGAIRSFVADMGRSLWLSDTSVQFRDEPTETWFRTIYAGRKGDFENYIDRLEPLAEKFSYVAEILPQLYLQAEQYKKLIEIALSDRFLPVDNPIDERNVRLYRLQFAFKAALRSGQYKDAVKLAMRAGEEVAGNERQLALFRKNVDLLVLLQSKEKVQEIAFRRQLSGSWKGSENVYSASLLSGIEEFKGESRSFLRAGRNWLNIHFEDQRSRDDYDTDRERVENEDILELAYSYFNVDGVKRSFEFLKSLKPKEAVFLVVQALAKRWIDTGNFTAADEFLQLSVGEPYFTVAITSELALIGRFPANELLEPCLELLMKPGRRMHRSDDLYMDKSPFAVVAFAEACVYRKLPPKKILSVLKYYIPVRANRMVSSAHSSGDRQLYLRALAIRILLSGKDQVEIGNILPKDLSGKKKKSYEAGNDIKEFTEIVNGLFPWFFLRAGVLSGRKIKLSDEVKHVDEVSKKARINRYRSNDLISFEITTVAAEVLILYENGTPEEVTAFFEGYLGHSEVFYLPDRLNLVRATFRASHLAPVKRQVEDMAVGSIKNRSQDGPDELAEWYISLARGVMVTAPDDAAVYFDEAVTVVSKFGDEMVQRWEAVVTLAKKAAENGPVNHQLAYRFIRCAEVVGELVSREKHWSRNEAVMTCVRMDPAGTIAALSRWRDRGVGWFPRQVVPLCTELVRVGAVSPATGWALTAFDYNHQSIDFISLCLEKEKLETTRQQMLDDAVNTLLKEGTDKSQWAELKKIASSFGLRNDQVDRVSKFYSEKEKITVTDTLEKSRATTGTALPGPDWNQVFNGLNIVTLEGFTELVKRFNALENERQYDRIVILLKEALRRLQENDIWTFIDTVMTSDMVQRYDFQSFFSALPNQWISKASFKKRWPALIKRFGKHYATDFTSEYSFSSFIEAMKIEEHLVPKLKEGIMEGLAEDQEFANARIFFGFADVAAALVDAGEAAELTDFSLSRFELHIEENFGDGLWADWLQNIGEPNSAVAGFIWSALGSPRRAIRWNAAHAVLKLAQFNNSEILDALVSWMEKDKVDAFGSKDFPFYNLHARLYLLIALNRIAAELPEVVKKYHEIFSRLVGYEPHILIRKLASEIALQLEKNFPGTYTVDQFQMINNACKTDQTPLHVDYNYSVDSYWHARKEIKKVPDYRCGWDFEQYWFAPLGRVFGVGREQVQDLVIAVITGDWGQAGNNGYNKDPRVELWNRSSRDQDTWHDHGSYPRADNLDFYFSYHGMFVVAAKLLEKMPPLIKKNWGDDSWDDWLSGYLLSRGDGWWLTDYRDPLPLERPIWATRVETNSEDWLSGVAEDDFLNCLKSGEDKGVWFTVKGGWHEKSNGRTETYSISTALVSKDTSGALLAALGSCSDPNDYKLPDYKEDNNEIADDMFTLKGWIEERSGSKGLDQFDPEADNIFFPPFSIGEDFRNSLFLTVSGQGKIWHTRGSDAPVMITQVWSSYREERNEEADQVGMRLKASLPFLRQLCVELDCHIIFDVGIKRDIRRYGDDHGEYKKPLHKVFILTADGKLITTGKGDQPG